MAKNIIAPKQIVNEGIELTEFGESLLVKGTIITNEDESGVLTTGFLNAITVDTTGLIRSETTAIQVEGEATNIENLGNIFGGFNGINVANGDIASALIVNGDTGVPDNQAAGVRLYWVEASGADVSVFNGDIENSGKILAENEAALIIEDNVVFKGDIINTGLIKSANPTNGTGIELENGSELIGTIVNSGVINGGFNGVDFGNGGEVVGKLINTETGLITSASRAVNIGGLDVTLSNKGKIITSDSPRNGVVYADRTALNFDIINEGLIDVGRGNDGDAISLQLGAEVNGSVSNSGVIKGRGLPEGAANNDNNQASAIRLYSGESPDTVSVFNGDLENSGILSAENGAAVIIEDRVQLNGKIVNYGLIKGGVVEQGKLAIDASEAEGNITLENNGVIRGDVLLTEGDDFYDGTKGRVRGTVFGNGGDDTLIGGQYKDILNGGTGDDELYGKAGRDVFQFGSDLIDGVKDTDVIKDFGRGDKFDFSQYLEAGGDISYSFGTGELLIELNEEDLIVVQGNILAAEKSLFDITEFSDFG